MTSASSLHAARGGALVVDVVVVFVDFVVAAASFVCLTIGCLVVVLVSAADFTGSRVPVISFAV